jgi:hypothetical protein
MLIFLSAASYISWEGSSGVSRSKRVILMHVNRVDADHSGRVVYSMNCLRSLERWDRGFESHSRHGCLCAFILCVGRGLATGWSPSKESYRLCIGLRNWKTGHGPTEGRRAVDECMNDMGRAAWELPSSNWKLGKHCCIFLKTEWNQVVCIEFKIPFPASQKTHCVCISIVQRQTDRFCLCYLRQTQDAREWTVRVKHSWCIVTIARQCSLLVKEEFCVYALVENNVFGGGGG